MANLEEKKEKEEKEEEEEILTEEEKKQIEELRPVKKEEITNSEPVILTNNKQSSFFTAFTALPSVYGFIKNLDLTSSKPSAADHSIARQLGLKRKIVVTNISDRKAWIAISPAPISTVSAIGIDKLGQIEFSSLGGEYKCQQSPLLHNSSREFDLDNNQIYYTVFFECDGKWKIHFKDRKINAKKHDINLLKRHLDEAVDFDGKPL